MRTVSAGIGVAAALAAGALAAAPAPAQDRDRDRDRDRNTHRIEIQNGPVVRVYTIPVGQVSDAERRRLRDEERAARDAALADEIQALRLDYVRDERRLQRRRTEVQDLYYGYASFFTGEAGGWGWGWGYPWSFVGPGPYFTPIGGWAGSVHSLALGVGDEGVMKAALIHGLVAPPARAERDREPPPPPRRGGTREEGRLPTAAPERSVLAAPGSAVVVTRQVGGSREKVEGAFVREDREWVVVRTSAGNRAIPKQQIVDVLEPAAESRTASRK